MKGLPTIPQVKTHKHLGLTINALKWTDHINNIYTSTRRVQKVGILRRLRKKLHPSVVKRIYTEAIRPKLEYSHALF